MDTAHVLPSGPSPTAKSCRAWHYNEATISDDLWETEFMEFEEEGERKELGEHGRRLTGT